MSFDNYEYKERDAIVTEHDNDWSNARILRDHYKESDAILKMIESSQITDAEWAEVMLTTGLDVDVPRALGGRSKEGGGRRGKDRG